MFTGIVTGLGEVVRREDGNMTIRAPYDAAAVDLGASIACDGCCLTVTAVRSVAEGSEFEVDVSNETLACTTIGTWQSGRRINLERALAVGAELGGHIVTGHVDGVARISAIMPDDASRRVTIETPPGLARFIAPKGSVTLDGTSLTVNTVEDAGFTVNLVPHTLEVTTWGEREAGSRVNIEVDLLARYVARLSQFA